MPVTIPESVPLHDTPILGMSSRPYVQNPTIYGGTLDVEGAAGFWVEYPDGLLDLTRTHWFQSDKGLPGAENGMGVVQDGVQNGSNGATKVERPPLDVQTQVEIEVDGEPKRRIRVSKDKCALVVIDMQKYVWGDNQSIVMRQTDCSFLCSFFLHPDLRNHPKGLACVQPLMDVIPKMRELGMKILWV